MKKIIVLISLFALASMTSAGGLESLTNYQALTTQKINLDLNNADVDDAMNIFSEKMNVNIVKNKNVETKVTVHLKDISVIDAFRILCRTHNLNYQAEKRLIQIYNQKDMLKEEGYPPGI